MLKTRPAYDTTPDVTTLTDEPRERHSQAGGRAAHVLRSGGIRIDLDRRSVSVRGRPVTLTRAEFRLLKLLIQANGRALSSRDLVRATGKGMSAPRVPPDLHVRRLKEKLRAEGHRISTVSTVDYYFGEAS